MSVRVFVMAPGIPSLGFNALDLLAVPRIGETINVIDLVGDKLTSRWFVVTSVCHAIQSDFEPCITIYIEKKT